jgi:ferrochelatase
MSGKTGVLLVNLGTPDAPTPEAVRRYLAEFLSDRRVVDLPKLLWWPILYGIVLRTRPARSAEAYSQVWTEKGSPLAAITAEQAEKLRARLGDAAMVVHAMRYGNPSIASGLQKLRDAGCERVLVVPLYPQYSGATNASSADAIVQALDRMHWKPELRTLPPYYADPAYIGALVRDIGTQLEALPFAPEKLLLSFHGLPQRVVDKGDPYYDQCQETARLLIERLDRPDLLYEVTFQSRFGRAKWLEPATDLVLDEDGRIGYRLAVAAPGFAADCLETLEELAIRGREQFEAAGGEQYAVLSCLNAGEAGMEMLEALVRRELAGWRS